MRAAERAAERRRRTDWFYAKYSTFEESEEAMLDEAARRLPDSRRLRVIPSDLVDFVRYRHPSTHPRSR